MFFTFYDNSIRKLGQAIDIHNEENRSFEREEGRQGLTTACLKEEKRLFELRGGVSCAELICR